MGWKKKKVDKEFFGGWKERRGLPSPELQERIRQLDTEGHSRIQIARIIGTHYQKVAIVLGKLRRIPEENVFPGHDPDAPYVRCRTCGAPKVQLPCLKCFLNNRGPG